MSVLLVWARTIEGEFHLCGTSPAEVVQSGAPWPEGLLLLAINY